MILGNGCVVGEAGSILKLGCSAAVGFDYQKKRSEKMCGMAIWRDIFRKI